MADSELHAVAGVASSGFFSIHFFLLLLASTGALTSHAFVFNLDRQSECFSFHIPKENYIHSAFVVTDHDRGWSADMPSHSYGARVGLRVSSFTSQDTPGVQCQPCLPLGTALVRKWTECARDTAIIISSEQAGFMQG